MQSHSPTPSDRVAFYGRVSQPRQKLEQQVELGQSWCMVTDVSIPMGSWHLDKGGRRHKSGKRHEFQRLMDAVEAEKYDWVVVALFDRWGVADIDEFFDFRRRLKENGVRLYSIQDNLELTSAEERDCWQIFAKAMGSFATMEGHADKNIIKMVERALNGWHLSGSHPYGTDLMCCRLSDKKPVFRVHLLKKDAHKRGHGDWLVQYLDEDGRVLREEQTRKMPPRDCKETGYRLVPSLDHSRIQAVRLIHELYVSGMENGQISKTLMDRGIFYYGKGWGFNCIESILGNSAYIGMPAWGKTATGFYRQVFDGRSVKPPHRKRHEATQYIKEAKHFIYPRQPVFPQESFMPLEMYERAAGKMAKRRTGPKRTKSRDTSKHPLAGLLRCPDCSAPMDISGTQSKGDRVRYFICSTYVRTRRQQCKANSVKWKYLDLAAAGLMSQISDQLKHVTSLRSQWEIGASVQGLVQEHLGKCELINGLFFEMATDLGIEAIKCDFDLLNATAGQIRENRQLVVEALLPVFDRYFRKHEMSQKARQRRVADLEAELDRLAIAASETPSKRQRDLLWAKSTEIEKQIDRMKQSSTSLTDRMLTLVSQAEALERTISDTASVRESQVWHAFVESITPIWRDNRKPREPHVAGFKFTPKAEMDDFLPHAMEIFLDPRGRGSARRSA